jgi:pimeloyl-ACP methyl ester carboxylesterase
LAEQGYIGYAKARATTSESILDSFVDVTTGLEELLEVPTLDNSKMAMLGYSHGGLLSLRIAELHPELFDSVVLMAPAPGAVFGDGSTTMVLIWKTFPLWEMEPNSSC